ncbi:hypothetical protein V6Z12_D10G084000 [Gossypium hirsutum]
MTDGHFQPSQLSSFMRSICNPSTSLHYSHSRVPLNHHL